MYNVNCNVIHLEGYYKKDKEINQYGPNHNILILDINSSDT